MQPLPILQHPDPVLRGVCPPVTDFSPCLTQLAEAMLATMYAAPGRGLAAPQIGRTERIFVMDCAWKERAPTPLFCVNPRILSVSEERAVHAEGCLSIRGVTWRVSRPAALRLAWQDLTGAAQEAEFAGFEAVCIQHEADHLDGVLCIDHPEAPE